MALDIARRRGARVTLLHVVADHVIASPHEVARGIRGGGIARVPHGSALRSDAERIVRRVMAPFVAAGVPVTCDVVSGARADAILEIARRRRTDLVVVTHRRAVHPGAQPGSATVDHVIAGAPCAVMLVKPRGLHGGQSVSHPICAEIW